MLGEDQVPAAALAAFERSTGLRVSIHDLAGTLSAFLPPERFGHGFAPCAAVKRDRVDRCMAFDVDRVREVLPRGDGLIKTCHAGLVEWVVPVAYADALEWVVFAGVRRAGRGLARPDLRDQPLTPPPNAARAVLAVPTVDADEAAWLLEALRQLAARLSAWRAARRDAPRPGRARSPRGRALVLRRLVGQRLADPAFALADAARALGLSESRAGRAIKQACGVGFARLVATARLRAAAALLREGELRVADAARRCGFADRGHFHAAFRAEFGVTPAAWRRAAPGP